MHTHYRTIASTAAALFALGASAAACGSTPAWTLRPTQEPPPSPAGTPAPVDLLLAADLQYHIPFQELLGSEAFLRLGPTTLPSARIPSAYRHVGANFFMPGAMRWVAKQAIANGIRFGVLLGDVADLGCVDEFDEILRAVRTAGMPVIVVPGNHDMAPFGSLSPEAHSRAWQSACVPHGGPLTKSKFVERLLSYYHDAWHLPPPNPASMTSAVGIMEGNVAGATLDLGDGARATAWLHYRFRQDSISAPGDIKYDHRDAWVAQRFELAIGSSQSTLTIVDSVDYIDSSIEDANSAPARKMVGLSIGQGGAVSSAQMEWLRNLPPVAGHHYIISHYPPLKDLAYEGEERLADVDVTLNAETSGLEAFLFAERGRSALVYAHTHEPFGTYLLSPSSRPSDRPMWVARIPSLVDNRVYVWLRRGRFEPFVLPKVAHWEFRFEPPRRNLCDARRLEFEQIVNALRRPESACGQLPTSRTDLNTELRSICQGRVENGGVRRRGEAWIMAHAKQWRTYEKERGCEKYDVDRRWRCILRERLRDELMSCNLEMDPGAHLAACVVGSTVPLP